MKSFWQALGHALAVVAKGAAKGAVWASEHPEAVQMVGALAIGAGAPAAVVGKVEYGVTAAGAAAKTLGPKA